MPTPLDVLQDPATQVMLAMFAGLALWDFIAPGRPLPRVRKWTLPCFGGLTRRLGEES